MKSAPIVQTRPPVIRRFALVFGAALVLYPLVVAAGLAPGGRFAPVPDGALLGTMVLAQIAAMIMVYRGSYSWARWLVCTLLLLDFAMYAALLSEAALRSLPFIALSVLQFMLHCAAVFLIFTPPASRWLAQNGGIGRASTSRGFLL